MWNGVVNYIKPAIIVDKSPDLKTEQMFPQKLVQKS